MIRTEAGRVKMKKYISKWNASRKEVDEPPNADVDKNVESSETDRNVLENSKNFKCDVCNDDFALDVLNSSIEEDWVEYGPKFSKRPNLCPNCLRLELFDHVEKGRSKKKEFDILKCDACNAYFKRRNILYLHKQYLCEYKCEECGLKFPKIDLKEHSLKHKETGVKAQREENKIINCNDCEYSARNFNDFGKHIYEEHGTVGRNDHKIVDAKTIGTQTEESEFIKCDECEHPENLDGSQRDALFQKIEIKEMVKVEKKEAIVQTGPELLKCNDSCTDDQKNIQKDKKDVNVQTEPEVTNKKEMIVQTEPVFIKSKECESSKDNLNENFVLAASVQIEEQELKFSKCLLCSENFQSKGDLMSHMKVTHKEKVKICSKFAAGTHCIYGSKGCWYIHKGEETDFECKICEKVFRTLSDVMRHNKQEHYENIANCFKEEGGNCKFGPRNCWFRHKKIIRNNGQKEKVLKCRTCEQIFNTKNHLMKHRKQEHSENVESCCNAANESCTFGAESCWFKH